jgi:hypothetical protein
MFPNGLHPPPKGRGLRPGEVKEAHLKLFGALVAIFRYCATVKDLDRYCCTRYMVIMKLATSFRLSKQAHEILALLSEQKGISKASVIEIALRELAAREKLRG